MTISEISAILNLLRTNDTDETRGNMIAAIRILDEMIDELDDGTGTADLYDEVDESAYDPYAGCDMYETESFDMGW